MFHVKHMYTKIKRRVTFHVKHRYTKIKRRVMFHVKHSIKYHMKEKYYEEIIKLAKKAYKKGEVPVGAIVTAVLEKL